MNRALAFLLRRTLKNRIASRLERLRQPKYLLSALAGIAYFYFLFFKPWLNRMGTPRRLGPLPDAAIAGMEVDFGLLLLLAVIGPCLFIKNTLRLFDEAEIQLLFPAPAGRADLIHYRIAKAQGGILLAALLTFILVGRFQINLHAVFLLPVLWLIYTFLFLFRMAVSVVEDKRKLRARALGGCLAAAAAVAVWGYGANLPPADLAGRLHQLCTAGPGFYLLYPFRVMLRPAFAASWPQLAWQMLPLLAANAAAYAWIRRSRAVFELSAAGAMETASGAAAPPARRRRRRLPPFPLAPNGLAPVAVCWKNLAAAGVGSLQWTLPILVALALLAIAAARIAGETVAAAAGSVAAAMAGFLTFLGPTVLRGDLRTDLQNAELLKTYPLSGAGIVLGEAAGPGLMLAVYEWLLVLIGAALRPGMEGAAWSMSDRIYYGCAAALVLPCLSFIGVLVQNAAVLLFPGWMHLGREHAQGVEAMGQRLIASIATMLLLGLAAVPAAIIFFALFSAGYHIAGNAGVPFAAAGAALVLLAEAALGVAWLGRIFDRWDVSQNLP